MIGESILVDWYFCRCIGANDDDTRAFLSVSAALRDAELDGDRARLALGELVRAGLWTRLSMLPRVVQVLLSEPAPQVRAAAVTLLVSLEEDLPGAASLALVRGLCQSARGKHLASLVAAACEQATGPSDHEPLEVPYLDLADAPDVLLILAVVSAGLDRASDRAALSQLERVEGSTLGPLLSQATEHRYGRLPMLLALQVERRLEGGLGREETFAVLARAPHALFDVEPDLVAAAVAATLDSAAADGQTSAERDEAGTLAAFRELFKNRLFGGQDQRDLAKRRLGPIRQRLGLELRGSLLGLRQPLGAALWQAAVWTRAEGLGDEEQLAEITEKWVRPLQAWDGSSLPVQATANGFKALLRPLQVMLRVVAPAEDLRPERVDVLNGNPEAWQWLITSPWLRARQGDDPDVRKGDYPAAVAQGPALLRMVAAADIATRMLRTGAGELPPLARFVIHAGDVVASTLSWLKRRSGLQSLFSALDARLTELGGGSFPTFDPALLLEHGRPEDGSFEDDWEAHELAHPRVMLRWLLGSLDLAAPREPEGRSLGLVADLLDVIQPVGDDLATGEIMAVGCLARFFAGVRPPVELPTWLDADEGDGWKLDHPTSLLLTPGLPLSDWYPDAWDEPDRSTSGGRSVALIRAAERLAAAWQGEADAGVRKTLEEELQSELVSLEHPGELPIFARVRLVEVLRGPLPEVDRVLLMSLLLEAGGLLVLDLLCSAVLDDEAGEAPGLLVGPLVEALAQSIDAADLEVGSRMGAVTDIEASKRTLASMYAWLARLALGHGGADARVRLAQTRDVSRARRAQRGQLNRYRIVRRGKVSRLSKLPGTAPIVSPQLRGAVVDVARGQVALLLDEYGGHKLANGFRMGNRHYWSTVWDQGRKKLKALAVVIEKRAGDEPGVALNLGCGLVLEHRLPPEATYEVGQVVRAELVPRDGGCAVERIRPLAPAAQPGDWANARVRVGSTDSLPSVHVEMAGAPSFAPPLVDAWRGDPLGLGAEALATVTTVRRADGEGWEPSPRDRVDLTCDIDPAATSFWLLYLDREHMEDGRQELRFTGRAGSLYVLDDQDFDEQSWEELEALLARPGKTGLVPGGRVRLAFAGPDGRLELVPDDGGQPASALNHHLLRLIAAFDDTERTWLAERGPSGWYLELDEAIEGLPRQVPLSWRREPARGEDIVDVVVLGWDALRFAARVEAVGTHQLALRSPADVRRWLTLGRDDTLAIDSTFPVTVSSRVRAKATVGALVSVDTDSLTLGSIDIERGYRASRRTALVTWVGDWKASGERLPQKVEELPSGFAEVEDAVGVIIQVPRGRGQICHVAWATEGEELVRSTHALSGRKRAYLGDRVVARAVPRTDRWTLQPESRFLQCRLAWSIDRDGEAPKESALPVRVRGSGGWSNEAFVEVGGGRLRATAGRAEQLPARGKLEEVGKPYPRGGSRFVAVRVKTESGRSWFAAANLGGHDRLPPATCTWTPTIEASPVGPDWDVRIILNNVRPERVKERKEPEKLRIDGSKTQRREPAWLLNLRKVLADGTPVEARWQSARPGWVELTGHRTDTPRNPKKPSAVRLLEGGAPMVWRDGRTNARVRLERSDDGEVMASFGCAPLSLEEYWVALGRPDLEHDFDLEDDDVLQFVGRETEDRATEEEHSESMVRFELVPGLTLRVPDSALLFDGQPFGRTRNALFHGDSVHQVQFVRDEDEPLRMDIKKAEVKLADGARLYQQRRRYMLVNMVDVVPDRDGRWRVSGVLGFAETRLNDPTAPFRVTASLLNERGLPAIDEQTEGRRVLARLRTKQFEETDGREIVFELIRLSFREGRPDDASPLEPGERVFLEVGRVRPLGNDVLVSLKPPAKLEIGKTDPIAIARRAFNVREEVLRRVARDRQAQEDIRGRLLLFRLSPLHGKKRDISASLVPKSMGTATALNSLPTRRASALQGWLRSTEEAPLAAVLEETDDRLVLELRPGVFVVLPHSQVERTVSDLHRGDIVRLGLVPGSRTLVRVSVAARGDRDFVPPKGRPVSLLPLDSLARKYNQARSGGFWMHHRQFTVEGLPDLTVALGRYTPDRTRAPWEAPAPSRAKEMLEQPGPHVAWLAPDREGPPRAALNPEAVRGFEAGRLLVSANVPRFAPLQGDAEEADLYWTDLTFADLPVEDVALRVRRAWWCHDQRSLRWAKDGEVHWDKVPKRRSHKGPVFFQTLGRERRLRYYSSHLPRVGFPFRELVDAVSGGKRGETHAFTVAGADEPAGRLWIELQPGRIAACPVQQLVLRKAGRSLPLGELALSAFAAGDEIVLRLADRDALAMDHLELVSWKPGARGLLGQSHPEDVLLLPVLAKDSDRGALVLGAGAVRLTLPVDGEDPFLSDVNVGDLVEVDADNRPRLFEGGLPALYERVQARDRNRRPQHRFIVLLACGDKPPHLAGMRDCSLVRDRQLREDQGNPLATMLNDRDGFQAVAEALGGVLPVTLEGVDRDRPIAYYGIHRQRPPRLEHGSTAQLHVLGPLPGDRVLVREGRWLRSVKPSSLVAGVPSSQARSVLRWLHGSSLGVWARVDEKQGFVAGVEADVPIEGRVRLLEGFDGAGDGDGGFVVRGRRDAALRWLSGARAAWVDVQTDPALRALFLKLQRRLSARIAPSGAVSAVDHTRAQREFRTLDLNHELVVSYVAEHAGRLFARAVGSGMWLEWRGKKVSRPQGARVLRRVEPTSRRPQRLIVAGSRRALNVVLDLPMGLGDKIGAPAPAPLAQEILAHAQHAQLDVEPSTSLELLLRELLEAHDDRDDEAARRKFGELTRRALRAGHVEWFAQWLADRKWEREGLWRRLAPLRSVIWAGAYGKELPSWVARVAAFCAGVEQRGPLAGDPDLEAAAASLRAATGVLGPNLHDLFATDGWVTELIRIGRMEPPEVRRRRAAPLLHATVERLRTLYEDVSEPGGDLPMPPPLPEFDRDAFPEDD